MSERLTSRQAAAILGVGQGGIARSMKRNGVQRFEEPSGPNGLRTHVTYDSEGVRALAAMREARTCVSCGGSVPQGNYVTCNKPICIEAREMVVRNAKNAAARIERWVEGTSKLREALAEPRADDVARAAIVDAWRATSWRYPKDRLRQTAIMAECNVATVLGVLRAMGEVTT